VVAQPLGQEHAEPLTQPQVVQLVAEQVPGLVGDQGGQVGVELAGQAPGRRGAAYPIIGLPPPMELHQPRPPPRLGSPPGHRISQPTGQQVVVIEPGQLGRNRIRDQRALLCVKRSTPSPTTLDPTTDNRAGQRVAPEFSRLRLNCLKCP